MTNKLHIDVPLHASNGCERDVIRMFISFKDEHHYRNRKSNDSKHKNISTLTSSYFNVDPSSFISTKS